MELLVPLFIPMTIGDVWSDFAARATSDWWRFGLMIGLVVGVGGLLIKAVDVKTGIVGGLGAGWIIWQVYNFLFDKKTHLFLEEPPLSGLFDFMFGTGPQLAVAVAAALWLLFSVWTSTKKTNDGKGGKGNEEVPLWQRFVAIVALWIGIMLLSGVIRNIYLTYFG